MFTSFLAAEQKYTNMDNLKLIIEFIIRRFCAYFLISFLLSGCFGDWRVKENNMLSEYRFKLGASVNAPRGYCIDPELIKDKSSSSFLAMVPCNEVVTSERPGLITVTFARADIRPNKSTLDLLEDYLTSQRAKIFHKTQSTSFVQPSKKQSVEISAMQKKTWQSVSVSGQYLVVVTLYIPEYVITDQNMAIKRLRSVLERITLSQSEGDIPILKISNQSEMLRPKARPQKS